MGKLRSRSERKLERAQQAGLQGLARLKEDAERILAQYRKPWQGRLLTYSMRAIGLGILTVVPVLITKEWGWSLLPVALVIALAWLLGQLLFHAKEWEAAAPWLSDAVTELTATIQALALIEAAKPRMNALEQALQTLNRALRAETVAYAACKVDPSRTGVTCSLDFDLPSLRLYLLRLCETASIILGGTRGVAPRCGLLVEHEGEGGRLLPIVVFVPGTKDYRSPRIYKPDDFSGVLLRTFRSHLKEPDFRRHTSKVIPNIPAHEQEFGERAWIRLNEEQRKRMGGIGGSVLYARRPLGADADVDILGVVNFDWGREAALTEADYESVMMVLLPVFRLMSAKLRLLHACGSSTVWEDLARASLPEGG